MLHPGEKAPDDKTLNWWMKQFKQIGSISKDVSPGFPSTSEKNIKCIRIMQASNAVLEALKNPLLVEV